jgi:beta-glucosidase-like glycosyl hydrolase
MKNIFYASKTDEITKEEINHTSIARDLAGECMVLLENNGVLPLKSKQSIALFGNGVRKTIQGGTGSGSVNVRSFTTIEQGLEEAGFEITTKEWLDKNDKHYEKLLKEYQEWLQNESEKTGMPQFLIGFSHPFEEPDAVEVTDGDLENNNSSISIYVISRNSGEGSDRKCKAGDYLLGKNEIQAIRKLSESSKKLIVVLNIGGVMQLTEVKELQGVDAVVLMGQLGNIGGNALVDLLSGKVNPSAKLADTWAYKYSDYPSSSEFSHNNGNVDDEYYKDGIYVGYRYFDSFKVKPLYPFGYGLSYTTFAINTTEVSQIQDKIQVKLNVENTGATYAGKEVVQVYLSKTQNGLDKPYQELVAFSKSDLIIPNENQNMTLSFPVSLMASYCEEKACYIIENGKYILRVGNSSANTIAVATLVVEKDIVVEKCNNILSIDCDMAQIKPEGVSIEEATQYKLIIDDTKIQTKVNSYQQERKEITNNVTEKITIEDVIAKKYTLDEMVAQLTVKEMAELCVGTERSDDNSVIGAASYNVPGAAGDTSSILKESRAVKNLILADGPAGLRLQPHFVTDKDGNILKGGEGFNGTFLPFENVPEDAVHYYQYCTAIPIGWSLAQSWNTDLLNKAGQIIGEEMEKFNIDLWLAPAMNIHRNPLCGRNFEYFSEDPLLTGKIAGAIINGVQKNKSKGTVIKHFAVNNQEENRYFVNAHVKERVLREIYLKGFEIAIKEVQPLSVMTSYNLLNGTHTANNYDLIQKALRDEWGFEGFVMTDWYTSQHSPAIMGDGEPKYPISSSVGCIKAGNDIQMPGCKQNVDDIIEAVTTGNEKDGYTITLADLQFNAKNILKVIAKIME